MRTIPTGRDISADLAFALKRTRNVVIGRDSAGVALCIADAAVIFALGLASHAVLAQREHGLGGSPVLLIALVGMLAAFGMMERSGYSQAALLGARPALKGLTLALLQAFGAVLLIRAAVLGWGGVRTPSVSLPAPFAADDVWLVAFALTSLAALVALRFAWHRIAPSVVPPRRVLVVGNGDIYEKVLRRARGAVALEVTGILYDRAEPAGNLVAGSAAPILLRTIRQDRIDAVVIALPWRDAPRIHALAANIALASVDTYIAPDLPAGEFGGQSESFLAGLPLLKLSGRPLSAGCAALKRGEDLVLAVLLVVLAAPAMLTIALLIKASSPGPVFFRQQRLGYNNEVIEVLKFRTMYTHLTDRDARRQTSRGDERVTPVGVFLRRSSLDELPQLLNVLAGNMSLIGPRPHALQTTVKGLPLDQAVSDYMARHRVKPGITGWAQVNGYRGELDSVEKLVGRVDYDLEYIRNWSLLFDLKILWRTTRLMLSDPHAY
jgi:polysaccharide biosynthesis protein PslA